MSGSKHFTRVAVIITALILVLTILFMNGASLGLEVLSHTMGYETRLFDNTRVHTLDIVMEDWDTFIANATSEEYETANVVIDGESYKNVGIRAKGNTSLSTVAALGSERYSFKVEFDHYDSTKSYHGLDKLCLNNLIQDSTMMKDYLTYTMMNQFGVTSSLCSYVYLTVNGEDWGLYLAVEGVEDAFLERNYGSDYGELYKPDSMSFGGGRGNGEDFDMGAFDFGSEEADGASALPEAPSGGFDPAAMFDGEPPAMPSQTGGVSSDSGEEASDGAAFPESPETFDPSDSRGGGNAGPGGGGGGGMGSSDVKLQYTDDDPDSYSNIWDNAKTDITEADQTRLIASLEQLSNYENLSSVVDVEQVIRYFVVHNYVCNDDSYTGMMVHNYYLYEKDGQLSMIPWDYNLGFGTFSAGDATDTVNTPIDAPVSGGSGEDRPMWYWILSDETYTELYHQYFADFLSSVDIQAIIDNAYTLIQSYVEKDPTAFYSYEEFELGVATLRQFCALRSESISMQLETGETASDMGYVDASAITLSDMGSMGGGAGGFGGDRPTGPDQAANAAEGSTAAPTGFGFAPGESSLNATPTNTSSDGQSSPAAPPSSGDSAENGAPAQADGSADSDAAPSSETPAESQTSAETSAPTEPAGQNRPSGGDPQMSGGAFPMDGAGNSGASGVTSWVWLAVSAVVLVFGLIVAKKYKG